LLFGPFKLWPRSRGIPAARANPAGPARVFCGSPPISLQRLKPPSKSPATVTRVVHLYAASERSCRARRRAMYGPAAHCHNTTVGIQTNIALVTRGPYTAPVLHDVELRAGREVFTAMLERMSIPQYLYIFVRGWGQQNRRTFEQSQYDCNE